MLTMGDAMQLKSTRPVGILGEMFGERIRGNLEQMQGHISPVDMLHFLSVPPELYIGEERTAPLAGGFHMTENRNVGLSLINNVLNRILVSEHMELTYQDRIFVENILKRIGVTDVKEFMRQVALMKEETGNVRELLSLYESGRDTIRLIQDYRREHLEKRERKEAGEKTEETEEVCRLAASVYNRLQTGSIYRKINQYTALSFGKNTVLDRRELAFGEQSLTAVSLSLNDYRRKTFAQEKNLFYNRLNIYELGDVNNTDETYGQIVQNILQAVLFNAVSQIFHIRYAELTRHTSWRHEFMDALHMSAQNTFRRFESLHNRMSLTIQDQDAYHQTVKQLERQEIHALKNLFAGHTEVTVDAPYHTELVRNMPQYQTTLSKMREGDTNIDAMRQEITQISENLPEKPGESRAVWEEKVRRQLDSINRQNIQRMERLLSYTSQVREPEERRINLEMARADGLKMLTGQEQVISVHEKLRMEHTAQTKQETEKLREILGEETVQVLETIRGYRENPGQYPQVTTSEGKAMHLLMQDIAAAGEASADMPAAKEGRMVFDDVRRGSIQERERALKETAQGGGVRSRGPGKSAGQTVKAVELFHRKSEQTVSEETMQELLHMRKKDIQSQSRTAVNRVSEENQVTEIVTSKVNEMKLKQDEEIGRIIGQSVRRQLDMLSEQVYGKLERRMDVERRRRGL